MRMLFQTTQGLLKDVVEWNLIDWASISREDTSRAINALWARGLREFAEMAAWLGENASREWADDLHAKVKAGFEAFWDEDRGSYVDHIVEPDQATVDSPVPLIVELPGQAVQSLPAGKHEVMAA